jgi:asparaginyl-tRNA synthetase
MLLPDIGEAIGGGQREERLGHLCKAMSAAGLCQPDGSGAGSLSWYLDLRRFGSVTHSGFGLGFDRYLQFVTGMANIRDVVPLPRHPGSARC